MLSSAHGKDEGFTLIELLVVIAIIAILAAILFPVFVNSKQRANQTKCLNSLKQIGVATLMYVDDWQGRYPRGRGFVLNPDTDALDFDYTSVQERLYKYTKSMGQNSIAHCPSDLRSAAVQANWSYFSYGFNCGLNGTYEKGYGLYNFSDGSTRKEGQLVCSARTLFATDADWTYIYVDYSLKNFYGDLPGQTDGPAYRHLDTTSGLFADGHVKPLTKPIPAILGRATKG